MISSKVIDLKGINFSIEKAILLFLKELILYKFYKKIKIFLDGNYSFSYLNLNQEIYFIKELEIKKNQNISEIRFLFNNQNYYVNIESIKKGDQKVFSISCASILSKVIRDQYMKKISNIFPKYQFEVHKGYGTEKHRKLIKEYGYCLLHRKSYHINQ